MDPAEDCTYPSVCCGGSFRLKGFFGPWLKFSAQVMPGDAVSSDGGFI